MPLLTLYNTDTAYFTMNSSNRTATTQEIDSALESALTQSDKERVNLLRLEQALVDLLASTAGWMEVGGAYNSILLYSSSIMTASARSSSPSQPSSFHRLLVHRLADRFSIQRSPAQHLEGGIRLVKVKETCRPNLLLTEWCREQGIFVGQPKEKAPSSKKTKVKIMKRVSSGSKLKDSDNKRSGGHVLLTKKSSSSFLEREKQYDEARARILGQDGDHDDDDDEDLKTTLAYMSLDMSPQHKDDLDPDFVRTPRHNLAPTAPAFVPGGAWGNGSLQKESRAG